MTIQSFDKSSATTFQREIAAAVKAIAEKHGVELSKNTGRYVAEKFDVKLEFKARATTADGAVISASLLKVANSYTGIDINKSFKDHTGKTHKLVDYNTRAHKTPFITQCTDGKRYRWAAASVRNLQAR